MKKNKNEKQLNLFSKVSESENVIRHKVTISDDSTHCSKETVSYNGKVIHMKGHLDEIYERILNRTMS